MSDKKIDAKTIVIKLGGHAMDDADLLAAFAEDIHYLTQKGHKIAIAHGGGPHINQLLRRLDLQSSFVNGLRVTDANVMEAVEMALCAKVNKELARALQKAGAQAAGISGQDAALLQADAISAELGHVGKVKKVNKGVIEALLAAGITPVIAPVALDDACQPLNVNADTAAGAIAGALSADCFILISDVPGVLDADKNLLPRLNKDQIRKLREEGIISGGMIPKTECCIEALNAGCRQTLVLDGRQKNSVRRFVENGEMIGTVIEK